jgi:aspartyl-tRNA(Asn)/glutamyl-tRNA(Gln) amidotransferase subunit A
MFMASNKNDELNWLNAGKLVEGYDSNRFTPVDVARACLAQIKVHEPRINAMSLVDDAAWAA